MSYPALMNDVPIVLFGAFDRHNLGDFLLGHAAALRAGPRPCLFAGLRAADLTACGGFAVEPLHQVAAGWSRRFGKAPLDLVHVGGEILDTDAWEAAVMLLDPDRASAVIARLDGDAEGRTAWATEFLGQGSPAPYMAARDELPAGGRLEFRAVGGVGLARRDAAFRLAVGKALASADSVTVRDRRTQAALAALGLHFDLAPDPATTLGAWLAEQIAAVPPIAADYAAVQFAASFGDDATLDALATALDAASLPVVLFRAGAAPWHDDPGAYRRLLPRLRVPGRGLEALHIREICAVIGRARCCIASSLHALLVAGLFGLPAIGLERRPGEAAKLRAYAETWGGFEVMTPDAIPNRMVGYGSAG